MSKFVICIIKLYEDIDFFHYESLYVKNFIQQYLYFSKIWIIRSFTYLNNILHSFVILHIHRILN